LEIVIVSNMHRYFTEISVEEELGWQMDYYFVAYFWLKVKETCIITLG
jgi:hypothetical protein